MPLPPDRQKQLDDELVQLHAKGATKEELQGIIDDYSAKYGGPATSAAPSTPQQSPEIRAFMDRMKGTKEQLTSLPPEYSKPWDARTAARNTLPTLAALATAEMTGGLSLLPRVAAMGLTGTGAKLGTDAVVGDPMNVTEAAKEGGKQAAIEFGGAKLVEGLRRVAPVVKEQGVNLMTRVLKPLTSTLEGVGNRWGDVRDLAGRARNISEGVLQEGLSPNRAGMRRVIGDLDSTEGLIDAKIANSTKRVDTHPTLHNLAQGRAKAEVQALPDQDVKTWDDATQQWRENPKVSKNTRQQVQTTTPSALVGPNGQALPPTVTTTTQVTGRDLLPTITIQKAQAIKRGTYQKIGDAAFGELSTPTKEANKAIARGLKEGIDTAEPSVVPLNERAGRLIDIRDVLGDASKRTGNVNPLDLPSVTALAGAKIHPVVSAITLGSRPFAGSPLANFLYSTGRGMEQMPVNAAAQNLRKAMLLKLASEREDDQQTPPSQ